MPKIVIKKLVIHVYNDATAMPSEVQDYVGEAVPVAAVAPAPQAPAQTNVPAFTSGNVLDFLRSDDRYRLRTATAVAKHFGVDEREASDLLGGLVDEGEVTTRRRRSDGVTLYEAA